MTREAFRELVKKGPVLLDGATGTNLQKAGMPVGVCPEQWILENSEVLIDLQKRYVEAGTDILFAPTFTASRIKLNTSVVILFAISPTNATTPRPAAEASSLKLGRCHLNTIVFFFDR